MVCTEGPERIRELIAMGASFDHGEDGNLHLAREGGHSHRRIVHAADMTGREIERALLEAVRKDPNIFMFEHHFAVDLLTSQVHFSSFLLKPESFFHFGSDCICKCFIWGYDLFVDETKRLLLKWHCIRAQFGYCEEYSSTN